MIKYLVIAVTCDEGDPVDGSLAYITQQADSLSDIAVANGQSVVLMSTDEVIEDVMHPTDKVVRALIAQVQAALHGDHES